MKHILTGLTLGCFLSTLVTSFAFAEEYPEATLQKLSFGNTVTIKTEPQYAQSTTYECTVTVRAGSLQPKFYVDQNLSIEANKIEPILKSWNEPICYYSSGGEYGYTLCPYSKHKEALMPNSVSFTIDVKRQGSLISIDPNTEDKNIDADVICKSKFPPAEMYDMTGNPG